MNIILLLSNKDIYEYEIVNHLKGSSQKFYNRERNNIFAYYFFFNQIKSNSEILDLRESVSCHEIDLLYLPRLLDINKKSLFVFDMDSTLIEEEIIDEVARLNGIYDEVARITEDAMQGNLEFNEALRLRCNLLKGLNINVFDEIYKQITLNRGVKEFLEYSNKNDIYTIILSGGFTPILEKFKIDYKISDYRANQLEEDNNIITGSLSGEIIDKYKKREYLLHFKNFYSIEYNQVVSLGDGSNDQLMLEASYIGIGYKPKHGLKEKLLNWISFSSMECLIFLYE